MVREGGRLCVRLYAVEAVVRCTSLPALSGGEEGGG
eukprot:CAMPEP_0183360572 /NCGR_PEP_ID=MMETSP0164_2-20130417/55616_1 /TAXON_ID=221442 /ORGANISM="Coccolithus pelagicus ssp braarudi, Strain PLY182g" /LENGTH=35 /DNA_ID= /DNA_START= /DNA_END= /DNA_ORIENTATION=